jgi:hypothetical protein
VAARLTQRAATPPREVNDQATRRERLARASGIASGASGGGSESAKAVIAQPDNPAPALLPSIAAYSLIAVGVAVVLVATLLIVRKRAAILAKWAGAGAAPVPARTAAAPTS